jgi:hypothetical protein
MTMPEPFIEILGNLLKTSGGSLEVGEVDPEGFHGWVEVTLPDTRRYLVEFSRTWLNGPKP